jgi:hypothetical protein
MEHGNGTYCSIKGWGFLEQMSNYYLIKKDSSVEILRDLWYH